MALLHRDDPDKSPLVGNVKATRQDWLNAALDTLRRDGVDLVKIAVLSARMGVSRSSFYWYFDNRQHLLDALLAHWQQTNTAALVAHANMPAERINGAVCHVFRCFVTTAIFDVQLDFAIRDWARKSHDVREILDHSDAARLKALTEMFTRYGYAPLEAKTRARVLYYMQIGYNDADLREPMAARIELVPAYLLTFTGQAASEAELRPHRDYMAGLS